MKKIAIYYCKNWLWMDLIALMPVYYISVVVFDYDNRMFQLNKIVKLMVTMRQFKGVAYSHKFLIWNYVGKFLIANKTVMNFVTIMVITLTFTHMSACLWAFLLVDADFNDNWMRG